MPITDGLDPFDKRAIFPFILSPEPLITGEGHPHINAPGWAKSTQWSPMSAPSLPLSSVETWVFDLDNTLYPPTSDLFPKVSRRMGSYIVERFGLPWDEARALQRELFLSHGTTMAGLVKLHGIDPDDYLTYVHDVDLSDIPDDPVLDGLLARLPGRKLIYTNGSTGHAERVSKHLGIDHHFEGCFDIVASEFRPKPNGDAFDTFLSRFGVDPSRAAMVEDMAKNLVPAKARGMATIWIKSDSPVSGAESDLEHIDHAIDDLNAFLNALLASTDRKDTPQT